MNYIRDVQTVNRTKVFKCFIHWCILCLEQWQTHGRGSIRIYGMTEVISAGTSQINSAAVPDTLDGSFPLGGGKGGRNTASCFHPPLPSGVTSHSDQSLGEWLRSQPSNSCSVWLQPPSTRFSESASATRCDLGEFWSQTVDGSARFFFFLEIWPISGPSSLGHRQRVL